MEIGIESVNEFQKYYEFVKSKIEEEITKYNLNLKENEHNNIIKDALSKLVYLNSDGKCLRSVLVALGYQAVKKDDSYIPLALAIELFQTSILIHDDIIDKALKRRGKNTIPVLYKQEYQNNNDETYVEKLDNISNSMALCIGDIGFYLANQILLNNYSNHPNLSKFLSYYNDMVIKTCKGEMVDVFLPFKEEYHNHSQNLEKQIMEIYTLKTAWYSVIGPFCLGLVLANASDKLLKECEDALLNVGIAFQIKDDLLGIYADEGKTGKTASDIIEYKQTILYSYTLNTNYKDELLKYYGTDNTEKIKEIFINSGAKQYAQQKMNEIFNIAIQKIKQTSLPENTKTILLGFIYYLKK